MPHALLGTAVAIALRHHPVLAFFAAFGSHFILDAIPHWHYPLRSLERNRQKPIEGKIIGGKPLARDILVVLFDGALGSFISIAVTFALFPRYIGITLIGIAGGILPDFLQFLYYLFPRSPLKYLQRFHLLIHAKKRLDKTPVSGIAYQLAFTAVCAFILKYF